MIIKKGQIVEFSTSFGIGKKKVKILKIHRDKHCVTSITYRDYGFIARYFGYKNTITADSFRNRIVGDVDEAEI